MTASLNINNFLITKSGQLCKLHLLCVFIYKLCTACYIFLLKCFHLGSYWFLPSFMNFKDMVADQIIFTHLLFPFQPRIDDKHLRWLHLRIRPSSFPFTDTATYTAHGKVKSKALVDGRWTLAFKDEESCKLALSMVVEEMKLQSCMVERSLQPLLELDRSKSNSEPS